MQTIKEVRDELTETFQNLKNGSLDVKTASEMNNSAGKIIKSLSVQLEYFSLRDEKPQIDFFKCH